jgi:hypothetical protein
MKWRKLMKRQIDEKTSRQNGKLTRCQEDAIVSWQNSE